jgi:Enoyl-CoA hydratase/isomerase
VDEKERRVLDAPEAADLLAAGFADELGPLTSRPLLAFRVGPGWGVRGPGPVRDLPCVTVAIDERPHDETAPRDDAIRDDAAAPPPADVLLTTRPDAPRPWVSCPDGVGPVLAALDTAIRASPLAAVALVQLLRLSGPLALADAIVAESFVYSMLQAGPEFAHWLASRPPRPSPTGPAPAAGGAVLLARDRQTLRVTLNRPRVRNAFDVATREALIAAFDVAAADPEIANIHLSGAGPAFCSGGDLTEFGTSPDPATSHAIRVSRSAARAIAAEADRLTAHLHGPCIGAGIELPAFARRVLAAPDTTVRLPEVAMGLIPGAGGTASLPRRIGRERTAYLALTGVTLTAADALTWGLVDAIDERR